MTRAERTELREKGYSLQDIADMEGISRQAVHQSLTGVFHPKSLERIVYPALKQWMIDNCLTIAGLNRRLGLATTGAHHSRTYAFLKGTYFSKELVDGVLRESGLTYEEAFRT